MIRTGKATDLLGFRGGRKSAQKKHACFVAEENGDTDGKKKRQGFSARKEAAPFFWKGGMGGDQRGGELLQQMGGKKKKYWRCGGRWERSWRRRAVGNYRFKKGEEKKYV